MHIPVLQKEVLEYLQPESNEDFIDCTLGEGGHTLVILEKTAPLGKIISIDSDPESLKRVQSKIKESLEIKERIIFVNDNFVNLKKIVEKYNFSPSGILLDIGFSSWHLEESKKGFSFQKNEKLDMRYNPQVSELTAKEIVNNFSQDELERIIRDYSQEKFAGKITRQIIKEREKEEIETTFQLRDIIWQAVPVGYRRGKIHPATRTFQAIRIAVNDELENLKKTLPQALEVLKLKGRIAVISFHSLEDRIVKNFFREKAKEGLLKILTKKPVKSSVEEISINPRSRSALLRVAQKIKK